MVILKELEGLCFGVVIYFGYGTVLYGLHEYNCRNYRYPLVSLSRGVECRNIGNILGRAD